MAPLVQTISFAVGADQRGDLLAGGLHRLLGVPAERVALGGGVAELLGEVGQHRLEHPRIDRAWSRGSPCRWESSSRPVTSRSMRRDCSRAETWTAGVEYKDNRSPGQAPPFAAKPPGADSGIFTERPVTEQCDSPTACSPPLLRLRRRRVAPRPGRPRPRRGLERSPARRPAVAGLAARVRGRVRRRSRDQPHPLRLPPHPDHGLHLRRPQGRHPRRGDGALRAVRARHRDHVLGARGGRGAHRRGVRQRDAEPAG